MFNSWRELIQTEFMAYNFVTLRKDLLAGLTVAAVALPLALAYGVAAGVDAAAGLVTGIVAGILVGFLGGAPASVSGPTGGLAAVIAVFAVQFGMQGVWMIGLISGVLLILMGVFRLGRLVTLMPTPAIAGYTSGVAIIIAVSQIDNALGIRTPSAGSTWQKAVQYFQIDISPNWSAVLLTLLVVGIMIIWPRFSIIADKIPGSLAAIIIAKLVFLGVGLDVPTIGDIPRSILLEDRFGGGEIVWTDFLRYIFPAITVTVLVSIESLLCGALAENQTGRRPSNEVELTAQGIANLVVPFFGGIAASAALSRTAVNLRAEGQTRVSPIVHGLVLLLIVLVLAPIIGRVPLSALAGVLIMTAWRMNQWARLRFYFSKRLKHAIIPFLATVLVSVFFSLTQAIFIGIVLCIVAFALQMGTIQSLWDGSDLVESSADNHHYRVHGPIFFGASRRLLELVEANSPADADIVLSLAESPLLDATGIEMLQELRSRQSSGGGSFRLTNLAPRVESMLKRSGSLAGMV